jgi:hypothetical protein
VPQPTVLPRVPRTKIKLILSGKRIYLDQNLVNSRLFLYDNECSMNTNIFFSIFCPADRLLVSQKELYLIKVFGHMCV